MRIKLIEANTDLGLNVNGTNLGPSILTKDYDGEIDIIKINKPNIIKEHDKENKKKNIEGVNEVNTKLYNNILNIINDNYLPITIGGDHSIAIASALASIKANKRLGVIWIDAHGDYNTFDTTETGNIHGLPLATLNGLCEELSSFFDGNFYKCENTVIVGARDIDPLERINLENNNIKIFTTEDIKKYGVKFIMDEAFKIATKNTFGVHISYDLDIIDPKIAPGVSVPAKNGISENEAYDIIKEIIENKKYVKSFDLVEFNPSKDINSLTKEIAQNILKKIIE